MSIPKICEKLKSDPRMMLYPPASDSEIRAFEKECLPCGLPVSLSELLRQFDGGELFVPGTTIHGIKKRGRELSLSEVNNEFFQSLIGRPDRYLIFATMNFGDMLLIDRITERILQYDHETGEIFCSWPSLENWLACTLKEE